MGIIRFLFISLSVVVLSTLSLNAFDNIATPGNSLLASAFSALTTPPCPSDMAFVPTSSGGFCIDRYEASAGDDCAFKNPLSKQDTDDNLALQPCVPRSVVAATPWRNVTRQQAELACVRAGKRLPTNEEWYRAALGTPDKSSGWGSEDCNVSTLASDGPEQTGSRPLCVSVAGAYDMIGNVWEWLEETVDDDRYEDTTLPQEGFIASINEAGTPLETDPVNPDEAFFEDYFWFQGSSVRGMLRGGYWKSKSDAGQYALNVTVPPSFVGNAVGFRCARGADL